MMMQVQIQMMETVIRTRENRLSQELAWLASSFGHGQAA
jgi:hypothetical protein